MNSYCRDVVWRACRSSSFFWTCPCCRCLHHYELLGCLLRYADILLGFFPYHIRDPAAILGSLGFPLSKCMQHGGHFSPSATRCLCSLPAPSLPLTGALQILGFLYLPLIPSSPTTAPLQSSTLKAFFWFTGEGFAWERYRKVKSAALPQQLRGRRALAQ